jgi:hypothetical protein
VKTVTTSTGFLTWESDDVFSTSQMVDDGPPAWQCWRFAGASKWSFGVQGRTGALGTADSLIDAQMACEELERERQCIIQHRAAEDLVYPVREERGSS